MFLSLSRILKDKLNKKSIRIKKTNYNILNSYLFLLTICLKIQPENIYIGFFLHKVISSINRS